jgi:ABC-type antimicrobial peptide transport system permease subunit
MALGAPQRVVLALLLKESLASLALGIVLGCILAFAFTRVMAALLYNVAATDPLTFAGAAFFLAAIAQFGAYIPARRAMAIEPLRALREQ